MPDGIIQNRQQTNKSPAQTNNISLTVVSNHQELPIISAANNNDFSNQKRVRVKIEQRYVNKDQLVRTNKPVVEL